MIVTGLVKDFPFKSYIYMYIYNWLCQVLVAARRIWFPDQGSNPGPLHWEHGVLATGPPGKSLDAFSLVITEIVIITYSLTGSSKFRLSVCSSPFSSVAAGFCVYESPAPTGSGGAAQEEMLHCALLPQSQFRCVPAVSCSQLAFRVPGLLF